MLQSHELEQLGEQVTGLHTPFLESLDPDWIEQALQVTGTASIRRRKIAAQDAVWLVLGMGLFGDCSIVNLVDQMRLVLPGVETLSPSAVTQARYRLGPEPLEWLFNKVAEVWADEVDESFRWKDLMLYAVDGTTLRVPDSDENYEYFGKPGSDSTPAGYPQVRLTCLLNLSTRMLRAVSFDSYNVSERVLANSLWGRVPDYSLTILDRGLYEFALLEKLVAQGTERHFLARVRSDIACESLDVLADGSELALLRPNWRSRKNHQDLKDDFTIRVMHYTGKNGKANRLFTTLLDADKYPAQELINLYHERWDIELAYNELKTHMGQRKESLRSKRPEGIEQELYGLLLGYNLIRREMLQVAKAHNVSANRVSFKTSLIVICNFIITCTRTSSSGTLPAQLLNFRSKFDALILPERRRLRSYPRHIKITAPQYPRNRGNIRTSSRS